MDGDNQHKSGNGMAGNFEPLIVTNDRKNIIKLGGPGEPLNLLREEYWKLCPLTVIDRESLKLIQVLHLHQAIDRTESITGSAILLGSLIQPSKDLPYIKSKQEALSEIAARDNLRQALMDFIHEYGQGEKALFKFFNKGLHAAFPYLDLKRARQAAGAMARIRPDTPEPESPYLRRLWSVINSFHGSTLDRMMKGAIYQTFSGLKPEREVGFFTPKLKFIPRRFTKWILAGPAVTLAPFLNAKLGFGLPISPLMSTIGLVLTGSYIFYGLFIKPVRDTEKFVEPLRKICMTDNVFGLVIDAVGMIDELLSGHLWASQSCHAAILPTVIDEDRHVFVTTGLKNPVLALNNPGFVPNNVQMNGARLTFISGPNSGGKTTLCKSIVHNQLLAQMGSYVLAEKATINIADTIRYQAPKFDGLEDEEGRFGAELGRTRDIFYGTGPKSLVILDELAEGTTVEERLQESFDILSDFHTIGNNTVLVTHNHSLVDRFMAEQKGQCFMVEFKEDDPTFRIIPGISRVSHANRIARKIKFSKEDRHRYLKEKGYL